MTILIFLFLGTVFLAYSNGANDNFKGVATLFGSGTTQYKPAIVLATAATFAGSLCSIFLAEALLKNFSGKGLVPDEIAASTQFLLAVAFGSGATVMLATVFGFPISTTHSLTGALTGAGLVAIGSAIDLGVLGRNFFFPLLMSPLVAVSLSGVFYLVFRFVRISLGVTKETCICVGEREQVVAVTQPESVLMFRSGPTLDVMVGDSENCTVRYSGNVLGIDAQRALDAAHYFSAGSVCFARGLNDTPKIVALLLAANALDLRIGMLVVAVCIAVGGLLNARKVAETMSKKITPLNHGQGFTANLVTALLVGFASRWGMPVSTTHVSVGSLFGIGLVTREANPRVVSGILLSWLMTLPVAAVLGGLIYAVASATN